MGLVTGQTDVDVIVAINVSLGIIVALLILVAAFVCVFRYNYGPFSGRRLQQVRATASQACPLPEIAPSLTPPYQYRPLSSPKHTRVLLLHPGKPGSPVRCSLEEVEVGNWGQRFDAISYRWGGEARSITCEDGRLDIQSNLYELLVQLRHARKAGRFWTDAVCINQSDGAERTQQVRLMTAIYSQCRECVVWLGWQRPDTGVVWELLSANSRRPFRSLMRRYPDGTLPALTHLLANEWFDRIWTLQEAVLAPRLLIRCGHFHMDGTKFYRALQVIVNEVKELLEEDRVDMPAPGGERQTSTNRFPMILEVAHLRQTLHGSPQAQHSLSSDFLSVLRRARQRNATDPRDKVIGTLGLCQVDLTRLDLGYEQSHSTVYMNVAEYILSCEQKPLRLLSAVVYDPERWRELPSWVPDWAAPIGMSPQLSTFEATPDFCAGRCTLPVVVDQAFQSAVVGSSSQHTSTWTLRMHDTRQCLHVKGKLITDLQSFFGDPERTQSAVERWERKMTQTVAGYGSLNGVPYLMPGYTDVLVRSLEWEEGYQKYLRRCFSTLWTTRMMTDERQQEDECWRVLTCEARSGPRRKVRPPDEKQEILDDIFRSDNARFLGRRKTKHEEFYDDLGAWMKDRKFSIARNGCAGWVPLQAQEGDWVSVIRGCDLPMILREAPDGISFIVIGHCYMTDIMRGEAMDDENLVLREIILD